MTHPDKFNFELCNFSGLAEFRDTLAKTAIPEFLQTGNSAPVFSSPFQRDSSGAYFSYVLFILDRQVLDNILAPILYLDDYQFTATYNNRHFLTRGTNPNTAGGGITVQYGSGTLSLLLFFPQSYINREVRPLVNLSCLLIGIIIFLSLIVILILTNRNYKPVQRLFTRVKEVVAEPFDSLNEFEAAEYALNNLLTDKNELLISNRKLQRDRLLLKLLNGKAGLADNFWDECRDADLVFNRKYYTCYIISVPDPDALPAIITGNTEKMKTCEIYTLDFDSADNIVLIICSDNIDEANDYFDREISKYCSIKGKGKVVNEAKKLPESYYSARHSDDHQVNTADRAYPTDDLNALKNAILACDEDKILFSFDNIVNCIVDSDNFFFASCVYSDFVHAACDALSDLNMGFGADYQSYFTIKLNSIEEIHSVLNEMLDTILKATGQQNIDPKKPNKNLRDLVSFINDNYLDRNFTVKSMAGFFGVTVSNLSHYYKQRTGRTLSDYIIGMKIEHARKLLKTTNMNLSAVSLASGYTEISAFIKVFKKITGMTPGEYRKQQDS
jgi:AraC-like DNA-binding protein